MYKLNTDELNLEFDKIEEIRTKQEMKESLFQTE